MKNADLPAMPVEVAALYEAHNRNSDGWTSGALGLTKREMFAMAAMQGFLAHDSDRRPKNIAIDAVDVADLLLEALERTK